MAPRIGGERPVDLLTPLSLPDLGKIGPVGPVWRVQGIPTPRGETRSTGQRNFLSH